jgi:hypothetical protein
MAYIGNTPQYQSFAPAVDYFNGDGTTVTFTLSRPVASVAQLTAVIDNVIQNPSSAFTVAGNAITFTSAPLSGTNNIWVEYTSLVTTYAAISQDPSVIGDITATGGFLAEGDFGNSYIDGTIVDYVTGAARITTGPLDDMIFYHGGTSSRSPMMDLYYAGGAKIYGTTALTIPVGTTAERPGSPANGMIRYNTTESEYEAYVASTWKKLTTTAYTYTAESLVIAGGGGGGSDNSNGGAGGGGAGGLLYSSSVAISSGTAYTVTVGAGGAGATAGSNARGTNGNNSVFSSSTAIGGGAGGGGNSGGGQSAGASGGSGGGADGNGSVSGGSGTSGQGNAGGSGGSGSGGVQSPGGGGGAGAVGGNGGGSVGNGGAGVNTYSTWATATSTGASGYYAGGGGGGQDNFRGPGTGGAGGGATGGVGGSTGPAGTVNTGGGAGGGPYGGGGTGPAGGLGGSGIVIIRYAGTQKGSGGTVVTTGGYTYHTFTSSGTFTG